MTAGGRWASLGDKRDRGLSWAPHSWAPKTSQGLEERPRGEKLEARAWVRVPGWEERQAG